MRLSPDFNNARYLALKNRGKKRFERYNKQLRKEKLNGKKKPLKAEKKESTENDQREWSNSYYYCTHWSLRRRPGTPRGLVKKVKKGHEIKSKEDKGGK